MNPTDEPLSPTPVQQNTIHPPVGVIKNDVSPIPIMSHKDETISNNIDKKSDYLRNEDLLELPLGGGGYISPSMEESTLDEVLDLTIKGDKFNRKILFIGSLLNYTKEDQLNFGLSGDSSTGKSHNCLEVAALHPKESVMKLSFTSPKAFFHDKGVVIDDETDKPMLPRSDYMNNYMEIWEAKNYQLTTAEMKVRRKNAYQDGVQKYAEHPKHLRVDLKQISSRQRAQSAAQAPSHVERCDVLRELALGAAVRYQSHQRRVERSDGNQHQYLGRQQRFQAAREGHRQRGRDEQEQGARDHGHPSRPFRYAPREEAEWEPDSLRHPAQHPQEPRTGHHPQREQRKSSLRHRDSAVHQSGNHEAIYARRKRFSHRILLPNEVSLAGRER